MSELYELPDGWKWEKLGNVFIVKDGTHDSPKYIEKNGYPLFTSKNLKENGLDKNNFKLISEEDYNKINQRSKVDNGDLLFAMIGTIGNPTIIGYEPNFAIKNVALFKPLNVDNLIELLKYYFLSNTTIDKMLLEAKGATQKFVGLTYLRNFPFPKIPLQEQKRIVSKLDNLFEKIDKGVALHQKNMDEADVFMGSVLNDVFGEFIEKYDSRTIKSFSKVGTGVTPLKSKTQYYENGNMNWITSKATNLDFVYDCEQLVTDTAISECRLKIYPVGTIIVALYGQGKTKRTSIRINGCYCYKPSSSNNSSR